MIGKVFEDALVPVLVGLCQVASGDLLAETDAVTLVVMGIQRDNQVAQAVPVGKLAEHEREQLVPAREVLDVFVTTVLSDEIIEMIPV